MQTGWSCYGTQTGLAKLSEDSRDHRVTLVVLGQMASSPMYFGKSHPVIKGGTDGY